MHSVHTHANGADIRGSLHAWLPEAHAGRQHQPRGTAFVTNRCTHRAFALHAYSFRKRPATDGQGTSRHSSKSTDLVLTEPVSRLDVDKELWEVLDLCSDDELETIYNILFGASPFSPVVKSIVKEDEPPLLQLRGRTSIMHKVCAR